MTVSKTQFHEAMFAERDKTDQSWPDKGINNYIEAAAKIGLDDPRKLSNPAIRKIDQSVGSSGYIPDIIKTGKVVLARLIAEEEKQEAKRFEQSLPDTLLETFEAAEVNFKDLISALKSETALAVHKLINETFTDLNQLKSKSITSKEREITKLIQEVETLTTNHEQTKLKLRDVNAEGLKYQNALAEAQKQIQSLQTELNTLSSVEKELATLKGKVSAYEAILEPKTPSRPRKNNRAQS